MNTLHRNTGHRTTLYRTTGHRITQHRITLDPSSMNPTMHDRPSTAAILWGRLLVALVILVTLGVGAGPAHAQPATVEQVFELEPGWNAIFFEVAPINADIEAVFAGIPVRSVWHWTRMEGTQEYIEDPADGLIPSAEWQGYFPRPRPEAFLTNLFGIMPNEAYLVEIAGDQPVTLRVSGRPALFPRQRWLPNGFSLTGLFVDPVSPPTLGLYFAPSEAHAGQPIYELSPSGHWQLVQNPQTTPARAGEAYWFYTDGGSQYQGPVEIGLEGRPNADYGAGLTSTPWSFDNLHSFDVDIRLRALPAPFPVPLAYEVFDEESGDFSRTEFNGLTTIETTATLTGSLDMAVRRAEFAVNRVEQIIEVTNGAGYRRFFLVGANSVQPTTAAGASAPSEDVSRASSLLGLRAAATVEVSPYAGLWVARALVERVSESQLAGTTPTPVGEPFPLRLIIHVDASGQARLLKEVFQLYEQGTKEPDPENPGFLRQASLGRYVLVTDEALISNFGGVQLRDGELVGIRVSSASYDFEGESLEMDGTVGPTGALQVDLVLPFDFPTNPYRHQYHPDHDNLDAQGINVRAEAFTVNRAMELEFTATDPREGDLVGETTPPDWGDSTLGGFFREEITGLHRNRIFVQGIFVMKRVAATTVLNQ